LARACLSASIILLFGPRQDLAHNALLSARNQQKRLKRNKPARIKVIIFFSPNDACEPRRQTQRPP
jgi:hypothetical protein